MEEMDVDESNKENGTVRRSKRAYTKSMYRDLLHRLEDIETSGDIGLQTINGVKKVLKKADKLDNEWKIEDRVARADVTCLDVSVLASSSSILKKCLRTVDISMCTYDANEFSQGIIDNVKNENNEDILPGDLLNLMDITRSTIPALSYYTYIYGSYDLDNLPQPKVRKERVKQQSQKEKLQKKEPEKVTNRTKEEESIEDIVNVLFKVLNKEFIKNKEEPIKYYDYIIDTDDFSNTVENMFYFAFLVRDGKASIDLDSKGEPIIKPIKDNVLIKFRDENGVNSQIVSIITKDRWQRFQKPGYLQKYKKTSSK
ncbi:unnamed protein product, partial [Phyllotreta striolata]